MAERKIVWTDSALSELEKTLQWIEKYSFVQAENVHAAILDCLEKSKSNPERYPPDKYKIRNSGHHRAFSTHSYRIAFRFTEEEIIVLRVRHVKQEPKNY